MKFPNFWLLFFLAGSTLQAGSALLECIGDTWIDAKRPDDAHSKDLDLELAGKQKLALMNFQFAVIRDWKVQRATLLLHLDDITPLKMLGVVPVSVRWNEIEATASRAAEKLPWDANGPLQTLLGKFDSNQANYRPVKEGDLGWVEVDLPPSLIEDCAAGRSHGFALFVRRRDGARLIHSRDTVRYAPTLKVEGQPRQRGD